RSKIDQPLRNSGFSRIEAVGQRAAGEAGMAKRGMQGTKDRVDRVKQRKSGQWASVSPDFLFLASRLYKLSEKEAQASKDGRSSKMVFAGIPLLLSSLTALILECESIGVVTAPNVEPLEPLPSVLSTRYGLTGG